jgi:hypothetical protein
MTPREPIHLLAHPPALGLGNVEQLCRVECGEEIFVISCIIGQGNSVFRAKTTLERDPFIWATLHSHLATCERCKAHRTMDLIDPEHLHWGQP